MRKITRYKKVIAATLLLIMGTELITPAAAYALTSGPAQPETQKFQPADISNMVDLFTGDMTYNIPLMDVGGYPINLAYSSGSGMDDEAGWVGLGWTLNPGAVNRQLRGLPDDFNGDLVIKEMHKKPFIKVGVDLKVKPTLFGFARNGNVGLKLGAFRDNYYGIGATVGVNASLAINKAIAGPLTAHLGVGGDLTTSSRDGVSVSPNINLSLSAKFDGDNDLNFGKSVGFGYNTRQGLKSMTLGTSFSMTALAGSGYPRSLDVSSSAIYTIGETHVPSISMPMITNAFTFDYDGGGIIWGAYVGFGASGYYTKTEVASPSVARPAYGYLNSEKGKDDINALMDFNREKDIPYFKGVPAIAIPVVTNDLYAVTNQEGVMQFRPFRSGTGIVFDNLSENKTLSQSVGLTAGAGALFQGGGSYYRSDAITRTEKWVMGNAYRQVGDFQSYDPANPVAEPVFFKRVGEKLKTDQTYHTSLLDESPRSVRVSIPGIAQAHSVLVDKNRNAQTISDPIAKSQRERRGYNFSYLTAAEAARQGLDRSIKSTSGVNAGCGVGVVQKISRVGGFRQPHHLSEITVTNPSGQRFVYGVPVYNVYQEEATFNVADMKKQNTPAQFKSIRDNGTVTYTSTDASHQNTKGRDHYYTKEVLPPYATSFLLSGILSPDYLDKTGDGITEDDDGTAIKFNYTKLPGYYGWRTPYGTAVANYNEGVLIDGKDDKATYVYGAKEVWYLHSIESKTMVAVFDVSDREDGLGAAGPMGGKQTIQNARLKKLDAIRLYSKADIKAASGNFQNATPIKVVHFEYDYSLTPNVPNHLNNGQGKLTLKKVWFTFGKNNRGSSHPYEFSYNSAGTGYQLRQVDRWGVYKDRASNPQYNDPQLGNVTLNNSEWPYAIQDENIANANAAIWQLEEIMLPSGGKMKITYEADDYAYVQNRRAMQMCSVNGIETPGNNTNLIQSDEILVNLPVSCSNDDEFRRRYLEGIEYLYYKFYIQLTNNANTFEWVPGYVKIKSGESRLLNSNVGIIKLDFAGGNVNPISQNTWQYLRLNLPQVAYPGYDNSDLGGSDFKKIIRSVGDAIANLSELVTPFDEKAKRRNYANTIRADRSWVRLCAPTMKKKGGGSRVKKIEITDEWAAMTGVANDATATYGQLYEYTTTAQGFDEPVSSGVAAYEPLLGGDENPFRQPIHYRESVKMGLDNHFYIEEPLCESYFPAAVVGYSKVKVTHFGKETPESTTLHTNTGYTLSEFFTARDFPTIVEQVPSDPKFLQPRYIIRLMNGDITDRVAISQGYKVELNDMHGKPKKEQIYNKGGSLVSMVEYFYKPRTRMQRLSGCTI